MVAPFLDIQQIIYRPWGNIKGIADDLDQFVLASDGCLLLNVRHNSRHNKKRATPLTIPLYLL